MAADGIFISYRREESAGFAGRLYDRLVSRFGRERVFMDVEGIDPGTDFVEAIERAVSSCRALIVVIGPRWTTVRGSSGKRRLDDPRDFVRLETSAALKRGIRVLPVLVDDAEMPRESDLPEELIPLVRRQAIDINHKHWESSTNDLLEALAHVLDGDEPSVPDPTPTRWRWGLVALLASLPLLATLAFVVWTSSQPNIQQATEPDPTVVATAPAGEDSPAPSTESPDAAPATGPDPDPSPAEPAEDATEASETDSAEPERAPTEPVESVTPVAPPVVAAPPKPEPATPTEPPPAPRVADPPSPTPRAADPPPPAPRVADPPPPAPRVADPPSAPDAAVGVTTAEPPKPSPLPQRGEQWTYSVKGMWRTSRERTYIFGIEETDGEMIRESMSEVTSSGTRNLPAVRWNGAKPEVMQRPGKLPEFSPYLAAFEGVAQGTRWRGVSTPSFNGQWDGWNTLGRVVGAEDVSVPAGRFRALKAEVWSTRISTESFASARLEPVTVRYDIWFAPSEKRYVKMVRTIESAAKNNIERDVFELRSVTRNE